MPKRAKQSSEEDKSSAKKKNSEKIKTMNTMRKIRYKVAGIDLGSQAHWVAAPDKNGNLMIREFGTLTSDLHSCANWLKENEIESVAMEATGVYWMHFYALLEEKGFEVLLVDARSTKNVSGRKNDVEDAEWIQQLHSYGLLRSAFIPEKKITELRTYCRYREEMIKRCSECIQVMQKALIRMNIRLDIVLSDISGDTGMRIINDIVKGIRDPKLLARNRDPRCKKSIEEIEEALTGCYSCDQVFVLQQELEQYEEYVRRVRECEKKIEEKLAEFETKKKESTTTPKYEFGREKKSKKKIKNITSSLSISGKNLFELLEST